MTAGAARPARRKRVAATTDGTGERAPAMQDALEACGQGVLGVDAAGRVLFASPTARAAIEDGDGLALGRDGELCASTCADTTMLHALLAKAAAPGGTLVAGSWPARIRRRHARRPLSIVVVGPMGPRTSGVAALVAVVLVHDPDRRSDVSEAALRAFYDLTPAEARLAAALARGQCIRQAAAELGVSLNTVRTHCKRVLAKTWTDRQSELVRLLCADPALRAPGRGRGRPRTSRPPAPGT